MANKKYTTKNNIDDVQNINKSQNSLSSNSSINSRHRKTRKTENVLILQGGGSLGAFGCGVIKGLAKKGISFDIICGTSIGAINGAVFVGNKNENLRPEENLENFWIEIAESTYNIVPSMFFLDFDNNTPQKTENYNLPVPTWREIKASSFNSTVFGVPKMFVPRWNRFWSWWTGGWWEQTPKNYVVDKNKDNTTKKNNNYDYNTNDKSNNNNYNFGNLVEELIPSNWTYIYDHSPLKNTLDKYINYKKLSSSFIKKGIHIDSYKNKQTNNNNNKNLIESTTNDNNSRLIVTAVNVLTSEPLVFDSYKMDIQPRHLLGCSGYPIYGFPWIEVEEGTFGWDGSLLNNTPLRQVLQASPRNDKNIYIVENYPRKIDKLPSNMVEVLDRSRDIIFSDKTKFTVKMSKIMTRQIKLIEDLYDIFEIADLSKVNSEKTERIKSEYEKIIQNYGAQILSINRITRERIHDPNILKNADFSPKTIRKLIEDGERKATDLMNNVI
jgi:NTE family protein